MQTIKHKLFGHGTIINKEAKEIGAYITVRFDASGKESRFSIPESFQTGLIVAEGDLKEEVESAIQSKSEAEQTAREAKIATTVAAMNSSTRSSRNSSSHSWATAVSGPDATVKDSYETYLIEKGYKEETAQGDDSTVPQYVKAVGFVLEEERLTWSALKSQISSIVALYGEGGAKEELGNKQHKTVINALKRFYEFVNS